MTDTETSEQVTEVMALRETLKTQTEAIDRALQHFGSKAYHGWSVFEEVSHALEPLNQATVAQRDAAGKKLRGLLHDLASARYYLDHERREAEDTRKLLRQAREEAKAKATETVGE